MTKSPSTTPRARRPGSKARLSSQDPGVMDPATIHHPDRGLDDGIAPEALAADPAIDPSPVSRSGSALDGLSQPEQDAIRRRAHEIWAEEGYPHGRDREHWQQAEMEILKGRP